MQQLRCRVGSLHPLPKHLGSGPGSTSDSSPRTHIPWESGCFRYPHERAKSSYRILATSRLSLGCCWQLGNNLAVTRSSSDLAKARGPELHPNFPCGWLGTSISCYPGYISKKPDGSGAANTQTKGPPI